MLALKGMFVYLIRIIYRIAGNNTQKSPELLARYCDVLLRKSNKNPEDVELEEQLNQVVSS